MDAGAVSDYPLLLEGKVRQVREVDDARLLIVATDRISAYDWIMPTPIPGKGAILTALSAFWFARTRDIVPNHLIELVGDRAMLVTRLRMLPVECVARGYLAGSGWADYQATGAVCGHPLPPGLRLGDRLPEPIFTPATKATEGHDENISRARAAELTGEGLLAEAERITLELYRRASERCAAAGIILADTKFELGVDAGGRLVLGDEALTPDSSRFWPADRWEPGTSPPSFDKQYLRDWLDRIGWDHASPPPELPAEVVEGTRARYIEAHQRITEVVG
ncbi:phosphoribosylaminoimidazolesuccinocarboxamide synthase [Miltoncostaea oceani]|uniref:phosphoribosylaminoimidazolesuccinocarboxamide synthase n=1 Tax=Miltoncostaea oceani TaxID=2843216 RepID=UPI0031BAE6D2